MPPPYYAIFRALRGHYFSLIRASALILLRRRYVAVTEDTLDYAADASAPLLPLVKMDAGKATAILRQALFFRYWPLFSPMLSLRCRYAAAIRSLRRRHDTPISMLIAAAAAFRLR